MIPEKPSLRRRAVLRVGLAGGALLAIGGGLGAWARAGYDALLAPGDTPIALGAKEFAVVRAIVDALFPAEDGFPSGLDLGLPQRVDEEIWAATDINRDGLKSGLSLVEHLPPFYGHPRRFTALSRPARVEVFTAMTVSEVETIRQVAFALKQICQVFYYGDPRVWPRIKYDGTLVAAVKPPESSIVYASLLRARRGA